MIQRLSDERIYVTNQLPVQAGALMLAYCISINRCLMRTF